jgi:hypothetical protein
VSFALSGRPFFGFVPSCAGGFDAAVRVRLRDELDAAGADFGSLGALGTSGAALGGAGDD